MREALVGFVLVLACTAASAQSQTAGEFWPAADVHVQFPDNWRMLAFTGLKKGEDFPYQQLNAGAGLAYQLKRFTKSHIEDVDPDSEEGPVEIALADNDERPVSPFRRERMRQERAELVRAMAGANGNKAEAARALGMARSTLVSRLKKFGLL